MHALVLRADQPGLDVKGRREPKAPVGEAEVVHQGAADVAHADQDRGKAPVHAENARDLLAQRGDLVAVALLSKLAEAVKILPYLGGCETEKFSELPGGYLVDAAFAELIQLAQIARQSADDIVGHLDSLHCSCSLLFHARLSGRYLGNYTIWRYNTQDNGAENAAKPPKYP